MQVISLTYEDVKKNCQQLYHKVCLSAFTPDLVLGIKTGGEDLAKLIYKEYKEDECQLRSCSVFRKSSGAKKKIFKNILHLLPNFISDRLRIIEAKLFFTKKKRQIEKVNLPQDISSFCKILIIDDAIDSGSTINAVVEAVKKLNPKSDIKTCVITVTKKNPELLPDFYLFNNETLIRFPWSMDAIKK